MLLLQNGDSFATGAMEYQFRPASDDDTNFRIILRINVEEIAVTAILDTGCPYLIISSDIADRLIIDPNVILGRARIRIRSEWYEGFLTRVDIQLPAKKGKGLTFQATTFVIDADQEEKWGKVPNFIGIESCLERIRFALDPNPNESLFYFGELS